MKNHYHLIIIGGGSAGLSTAGFMNTLKLKVLLIEKNRIGGDCLNHGFVPSKALLSLARDVHAGRRSTQLGLDLQGVVDMNRVAGTIFDRQEVIREHETPEALRSKGIHVEIGAPRFIGPDSLLVNGQQYSARRFLLATGSSPSVPPIEGLDDIDYFTNETIFSNRELPRTLLVMGAGPIGIELSQAYQRLGAQVTVMDTADRILPREDPDISRQLLESLEAEGITFQLGVKPLRFEGNERLFYQSREGGTEVVSFHKLLIATGRRLNLDGLDLDQAGVKVEENRLVLDNYLRTTNKRIYACGDVAGGFMFTHWAEYQASVVVRNMLSPFKSGVKNHLIARVIYTDPETVSFGWDLAEIKERGIAYKEINVPVSELDRAICEGDRRGFLKLYLHKGKIIGGVMWARRAAVSGRKINASQ